MIPKVPYYLKSLNLDQLLCFCHTHVRIVRLHMILFLHLVVYNINMGRACARKLQRARALHGATPKLIFNNWPHQLWTECAGPGMPIGTQSFVPLTHQPFASKAFSSVVLHYVRRISISSTTRSKNANWCAPPV